MDELLEEETVIARTIVELLQEGVLSRNPKTVAAASAAAGVPVWKVRNEWRHYDRWTRLAHVGAVTPVEDGESKHFYPANRQHRDNMRQREDGTWERRCCECKNWFEATAEFFYVKDTSTGKLSSYCHPCRIKSSRRRYLTVKAHAALASVGLEYNVADGDPTLICKTCGDPIESGQRAYVDGIAYHENCEH